MAKQATPTNRSTPAKKRPARSTTKPEAEGEVQKASAFEETLEQRLRRLSEVLASRMIETLNEVLAEARPQLDGVSENALLCEGVGMMVSAISQSAVAQNIGFGDAVTRTIVNQAVSALSVGLRQQQAQMVMAAQQAAPDAKAAPAKRKTRAAAKPKRAPRGK